MSEIDITMVASTGTDMVKDLALGVGGYGDRKSVV